MNYVLVAHVPIGVQESIKYFWLGKQLSQINFDSYPYFTKL
jgi:hypothetical protein